MLEIGKAAVLHKFDKLAELLDRHDSIFRGKSLN